MRSMSGRTIETDGKWRARGHDSAREGLAQGMNSGSSPPGLL